MLIIWRWMGGRMRYWEGWLCRVHQPTGWWTIEHAHDIYWNRPETDSDDSETSENDGEMDSNAWQPYDSNQHTPYVSSESSEES